MDLTSCPDFFAFTTLVFELDADSTAVSLRIKPDRRQRTVAVPPEFERRAINSSIDRGTGAGRENSSSRCSTRALLNAGSRPGKRKGPSLTRRAFDR